jgi:outer membrane receptor protein involved in Fe transport
MSAHIFNTSLDDMGNTFNDLRVQKVMASGAGQKTTLTGGLFVGRQKMAQTWYWNRYNFELQGDGAKVLGNDGQPTTNPVGDATTTWGGCCFRNYSIDSTVTAPYVAALWESGPLSVDASLRRDELKGDGYYMSGGVAGWNVAGKTAAKFEGSTTSSSVGLNYQQDKDTAFFGRFSKGASFSSPDRQVVENKDVATGLKPYPVNKTTQLELGVKARRGDLSSFVTLFSAKTEEDGGFEATSRSYLKDNYKANGIEAEVAWRMGALRVAGGLTLTSAEIDGGANSGNKPRRQADVMFQIAPTYTMGKTELGAQILGLTDSYAQNDNKAVLPGYTVINGFVSHEISRGLQAQLIVNNLFDAIGYTEAEGQGNLTNNPLYIARSINGRSVKAVLKYNF